MGYFQHGYNRGKMSKLRSSLLISPSAIWLLVFFLIPLAIVLIYSFNQNIYKSKRMIFSIEDSGDLLDRLIISEEIKKGFESNGKKLSESSRILIEKPGKKWQISDGSKYYFIRKKGSSLNIYPGIYRGVLWKLLFSLDMPFQKALDNGIASKSLQAEFSDNEILLSDYSVISKSDPGVRWRIDDIENRRVYNIIKENGRLSVYLRNVTFANYLQSLNPIYLQAILRSFWMAFANTLACLVIGYPVAYYISHQNLRLKNILLILIILPFWTNFLVRTYAWIVILREEGLINTILTKTGLIGEPLQLLFNSGAVLTGLIYGYLPFMILPLYASIEKINPSLLEAARDLGANSLQAFIRVTLPLTLPGITAGSILVFVPSFGAFVTPDLLGGAKVMMIGNLIQNQYLKVRNYPFGSALSFILLGVVLALLFIYIRLTEDRNGEKNE